VKLAPDFKRVDESAASDTFDLQEGICVSKQRVTVTSGSNHPGILPAFSGDFRLALPPSAPKRTNAQNT